MSIKIFFALFRLAHERMQEIYLIQVCFTNKTIVNVGLVTLEIFYDK